MAGGVEVGVAVVDGGMDGGVSVSEESFENLVLLVCMHACSVVTY